MTPPKHTRKFNYEAAMRGAPVGLECGSPVEILKWDVRLGKPIIGCYGPQDQIGRWDLDGSFSCINTPQFTLVMLPIGTLDGKPVFVGDILLCDEGREIPADMSMSFVDGAAWRWPDYPLCQLDDDALIAIAGHAPESSLAAKLRHLADAVLRDAVQKRQVKIA